MNIIKKLSSMFEQNNENEKELTLQIIDKQNTLDEKIDRVIEQQAIQNTMDEKIDRLLEVLGLHNSDLITIKAAAAISGKQPDTIRKRLNNKSKPPIRKMKSGKFTYLDKDFMDQW